MKTLIAWPKVKREEGNAGTKAEMQARQKHKQEEERR